LQKTGQLLEQDDNLLSFWAANKQSVFEKINSDAEHNTTCNARQTKNRFSVKESKIMI